MEEVIAVRFEGGPLAGTNTARMSWPPPDTLASPGSGVYEQVSRSELVDPMPGVMRGVLYRWKRSD